MMADSWIRLASSFVLQKIEQDESNYMPSSGTIKNKRLSKTNPTISHHQVRSKTKD
jgi:hypothetical protein